MRKVDATQGNLTKLIFIYTIPLILTSVAQQLFTIVDTAVLGNMFDTAYAEGADSVTFKCADSNVFSFVCDELIGNQQIFNFLHSETTSVVYSVSEEQLTLSFWL